LLHALSIPLSQLIRHGEKVKADRPGLSADGRRRAKCLRKVFGKGPLKAE
jgi:hypothetical protein